MNKLSAIKKYNPQSMKDEDLVSQFILRLKPYNTIINSIKNYDKSSTPQHFLIIAQRGMGKSTLLKRVEIEVRTNDEYSKSYMPVLLPEEVYNIETLSKFWMRVLNSMLDYLEITGQKEELHKWEKSVEAVSTVKTEAEVYQIFESIYKSVDRKPILIIDNIHQLFSSLSEKENWSLRSRLTGPDAPILISASPTAPDVFSDYHQAFYDYFKVIHLNPISDEEFKELTRHWIASYSNHQNDFINNSQRLEALFKLSGGNLRTVIMLFLKMSDGFGDKIEEDLDNLLDEITPYYKARIEELSDQSKNIVDAAALYWVPIDIKQLSIETGLGSNVLSPQIKRLRAAGWITSIESKNSKGDKYELVERFYNIWHIMRSSTRKGKRSLRSLACFIEVYYGDHLDKHALQLINRKMKSKEDVAYYIATSQALSNNDISSKLINKILSEVHSISNIDKNIEEELRKISGHSNENKDGENWLQKCINLFDSGEYRESKEYLETLGEKEKSLYEYWWFLGIINNQLSMFDKAEMAFQTAIEIDSKNARPWNGLGNLYQADLKDYGKAEIAFQKAIEIDSNYASPWNGLGNLYQDHLKDYGKAETAYQKAIELDSNLAYPWDGLGNLYQDHLKDYGKAETAYQRAIEIDSNNAIPWNNLGNLYQDHLNDYGKAEMAFQKAIELDSNLVYPWNGLGNLYRDHLKEYGKAEMAYQRAIEIDSEYATPWNGLGNLYQADLKDYGKAEIAYKKAIELDSNYAYPWNGLGNLYQDHLKDYGKAETAYQKAVEIDKEDSIAPRYNLIFLLRDKLNKTKEAKKIFETISVNENLSIIDSYYLNESLFHIYDLNFGLASESLVKAINSLSENKAMYTFDDWMRYIIVAINKGYGSTMIDIFKNSEFSITMRPLFEASVAMLKNDVMYFNELAAEVRPIARDIYAKMKKME
jgi:tetratricopeptide (TPR) repeat protein